VLVLCGAIHASEVYTYLYIPAVLALSIAVGMKYSIIGNRVPGRYNWDESSYCQRWQVYLSATCIIRNAYFGNGILDHLNGSAYLVSFFRAHGCHIGKDVCLYPTGADPIMTEPELVQIGHYAAIDDASLIAHINSCGEFSLNKVVVGPGATLRANSRVLSGAAMMAYSTLLEHSLVLGGDVVDEGDTMQGWPAEPVGAYSPFWRFSVPSGLEEKEGVRGFRVYGLGRAIKETSWAGITAREVSLIAGSVVLCLPRC